MLEEEEEEDGGSEDGPSKGDESEVVGSGRAVVELGADVMFEEAIETTGSESGDGALLPKVGVGERRVGVRATGVWD